MTAEIRRLGPEDAAAYVALRQEMLLDTPFAFLASPGDDFASDEVLVRQRLAEGPENVTFGAFVAGRLVGSAGIFRERKQKAAHKAHVWGVYVTPAHRGSGVGRALMDAVVAHAAALPGVLQITLSVSDRTPGARRLYESVGFRVWGTEPAALQVDGRRADEHHMVFVLGDPGRPVPLVETVRTGTVAVALPPDEALPLFTAVGETLWVPAWTPTYVSPPDGAPVEGGVWLTRDGETEVIWRVQRYDRMARVAEYLRIVPGNRVVVVRVECAPDGDGTLALVTYRITPTHDEGRTWLDAFTEDAYALALREWERLIAAYLSARSR